MIAASNQAHLSFVGPINKTHPLLPSQSIVTASASPFLFASLFMAALQFVAQIHDSIAVTCMHNRHPYFYLFILLKHTQNMFFGSPPQINSEIEEVKVMSSMDQVENKINSYIEGKIRSNIKDGCYDFGRRRRRRRITLRRWAWILLGS